MLGGVTTAFPSSDYELSGAAVTKYYLAGGGRLAMRAGATLTYLFGDHLGSTAITASADGMLQSELRYKPWGRRVSCRAPLLPTGATPASAPKTLIY